MTKSSLGHLRSIDAIEGKNRPNSCITMSIEPKTERHGQALLIQTACFAKFTGPHAVQFQYISQHENKLLQKFLEAFVRL